MTKEEKDIIADDLKKKVKFLEEILEEIFGDTVIESIPENEKETVLKYREGLRQIRKHISDEYEAILMGKVD